MVFVDRMTKLVHALPTCKTVTVKGLAELFIKHVFIHHGLPDTIVSDRDPRFMNRFWQNLFMRFGTKLKPT